ncbi:class I lanthipeptide [Lacinutrix sp. Hel_I_90]|uniref:class I lanthipeptide n=1 Tax=Lacinutrix sp. Hel_I_90 TaxID=1249999 RepID=UPI0005CAEA5A|nr:class I lanthipeptide [Lacinutrix sp. Hel_I_90]
MKTQSLNKRLGFNKSSVLELNDAQLLDIKGGTTPLVVSSMGCVNVAAMMSSAGCGAVGAAITGAIAGATIATN